MLNVNSYSFFEGHSELDDGTIIVIFYGQINDQEVTITEKEVTEDSYRRHREMVRIDRRNFENIVYEEFDRLNNSNDSFAFNIEQSEIYGRRC